MNIKEKTLGKKIFPVSITGNLLLVLSSLLLSYYSRRNFTQKVLLAVFISFLIASGFSWLLVKYLSQITHYIVLAFETAIEGDLSVRLEGKDLLLLSSQNFFKKKKKAISLDPHGNEIHKIALGFNQTVESFGRTLQALNNTSTQVVELTRLRP